MSSVLAKLGFVEAAPVRKSLPSEVAYESGGYGITAVGKTTVPQPLVADVTQTDYLDTFGSHVWVYAAVCAIATNVAQVPLKFYRLRANGEEQELTDHWLCRLFEDVNPTITKYELWEQTLEHLELTGNSYWQFERNRWGYPMEFWPLRPDRVTIIPDKDAWIAGYEYKVGRTTRTIDPSAILHFRYAHPANDYDGIGSLQAATTGLICDYYAQTYNRRFLENDARPGGFIKTQKQLTKDDKEFIREQFERKFKGADKAHSWMVLAGGEFDVVPNQLAPREMEWIQLRNWGRQEILAAFGVPAAVVNIRDRGAGLSSQGALVQAELRTFWEQTLLPKLAKFEALLNQNFIAPNVKNERVYCRFDTSAVKALQPQMAELVDWGVKAVNAGLMFTNEWRERAGLSPTKHGWTWWGNPIGLTPIAAQEPEAVTGTRSQKTIDGDNGKRQLDGRQLLALAASFAKGLPEAESDREAVWKSAVEPRERWEGSYAEAYGKAQRKIRQRILDGLEAVMTMPQERGKGLAQQVLDPALMRQDVADAVAEVVAKVVAWQGKRTIDELNRRWDQRQERDFVADVAFDLNDPALWAAVGARLKQFSTWVTDTIIADITKVIADGLNQGLPYKDIAQMIKDAGVLKPGSGTAMTIARTEVHSAAEIANHAACKQAGMEWKQWVSSRDASVRDTHRVADGQVKGVDEDFSVGSDSTQYPGEGMEAGENISCRCTSIGIFDQAEAIAAATWGD